MEGMEESQAEPSRTRWKDSKVLRLRLRRTFGKALRQILKGERKRELQLLEEKVLREDKTYLDGFQIYAWINQQFARDAKLARPQAIHELATCRIGEGRNSLETWLNKWDAGIERRRGGSVGKEVL